MLSPVHGLVRNDHTTVTDPRYRDRRSICPIGNDSKAQVVSQWAAWFARNPAAFDGRATLDGSAIANWAIISEGATTATTHITLDQTISGRVDPGPTPPAASSDTDGVTDGVTDGQDSKGASATVKSHPHRAGQLHCSGWEPRHLPLSAEERSLPACIREEIIHWIQDLAALTVALSSAQDPGPCGPTTGGTW